MSSSDPTYAQATCEKCSATFQVLAERIKLEGSTVKCGKCGHSFLLALPEHLKGNTTNPQAKLPMSAWGGPNVEPQKPSSRLAKTVAISGERLLNQSAQAKKSRRIVNVSLILVGVMIGSAIHLKRMGLRDIMFAIKYGISPTYAGLQVVKVQGQFFSPNPTLHFLKVEGQVFNHSDSPEKNPLLSLTVLSPKGEFVQKFPIPCCEPNIVSPEGVAQFTANVEINHAGEIGSYFLSDESHAPSPSTTN